jgi:hypothetical protein
MQMYVGAAVIATVAVAAYSHGLGGAEIAKWTGGATVFAGLIVGAGVLEERVMPTADPLVRVGFGGAVAFALFAALLRAQYRRRGE